MWFGEPQPFPKRVSPTRLRASGNKVTKGDSVEYFLLCTMKSGNVNPTQISNTVASLLD